jgi:HAE1 family hydrophobic/amphiphilic exporter-1
MQWLAEICVRRPVFATVLVLSLVVIGAFSYVNLGVDRFPKVDFPFVTVIVREDGASPQEIETEVVDKVEESVNTVSGIDQLDSVCYEGLGQVMIQFQLEKNPDVAAQEVRDKVNQVLGDLPLDIKPPIVEKFDPDSTPILYIALSAPGNIRDTTEYADKVLRRQLESIGGVGQVRIVGGRKRQINVWIDPNRLRAYNLTVSDLERTLEAQNIQVPGGDVDQGDRKLTLRTHGRVLTPDEFGEVIIAQTQGAPIRIKDVARVEDGMEEAHTVASLDGAPTVLLSVQKQSGLNTVATCNAVKERLAELSKRLPQGYKLTIARDQSLYIQAATDAVQEHLILGSLLAAIVVLLFLWNLRTTVISAIAIPASVISAFLLMYVMGFTLNSLTLLALTLSVGIVIDDAIVVLENIYRFIEEKGMNPFEAAIEGTREIGLAVMATTLSLIAIFLPVAFMTGIVGRFMNSFGLTMAFAIFVSLIVAFSLTPMLSSRWIKMRPRTAGPVAPDNMPVGVSAVDDETQPDAPSGPEADAPSLSFSPGEPAEPETAEPPARGPESRIGSKETGIFRPIDAVYTFLLRWSMRHRWAVVVACLAALGSMVWVVPAVPKNFLPDDDESQFQISVRTPEGTSLASTDEICTRIAADVHRLPGVDYTVLTIGNNDQQTENLGNIFVKLKDTDRRPNLSQQDVMQLARSRVLPKYGDLRTSVGVVPAFESNTEQAAVSYYISGPSLERLEDYSTRALAAMKKVPGTVDADTSLIVGKPELGVYIDRKRAADQGVSVMDIANALHLLVGGAKVTDFFQNGEQYEVHVRSDLPFRTDPRAIGQLSVPSITQGSVPLDRVVSFASGTGPSQITRLGRRRQVVLSANLLPGYSEHAMQQSFEKIIGDLHMPPDYDWGPMGQSRELVKAFIAFTEAFVLAIVFMYLILAAQFESWIHPITILLALPLTVPFALIGILIFRQSLNIFSILGILVLFGVVKKNGILQIDHTNQLRARGMERYDAIVRANRDRLRPILMTTVAFVAGMVPAVISNGTGAATNRAIGYTVIGGQSLALLLTLLATPVFYSIFDDLLLTPVWTRVWLGLCLVGFMVGLGGAAVQPAVWWTAVSLIGLAILALAATRRAAPVLSAVFVAGLVLAALHLPLAAAPAMGIPFVIGLFRIGRPAPAPARQH